LIHIKERSDGIRTLVVAQAVIETADADPNASFADNTGR
jgi:hypothetical protein